MYVIKAINLATDERWEELRTSKPVEAFTMLDKLRERRMKGDPVVHGLVNEATFRPYERPVGAVFDYLRRVLA